LYIARNRTDEVLTVNLRKEQIYINERHINKHKKNRSMILDVQREPEQQSERKGMANEIDPSQ